MEFDDLRKQLYNIEEKKKMINESVLPEDQPPGGLSEISKIEHLMECDRTKIDFRNEVQSLLIHEENFQRPRLQLLMNTVYIPKLNVKSFSAYIYGGEND